MALIIDLRKGIGATSEYIAFRFPGGELHFKFTEDFANVLSGSDQDIHIYADCKTSDGIMLLALVAETIADTWTNEIHAFIPYMPYQQADRKFSEGESFSLRTVTTILNSLPISSFTIFDAHSDVTPALLRNCHVVDNSEFILKVFEEMNSKNPVTILSPDAGAYKKIFKLAQKIGFTGAIETANKYRSAEDGSLHTRLSVPDFNGRDILIIDDICVGGRTFIELAQTLQKFNVGKLYLAVSHGVFSNGLGVLSDYFRTVYTTDSRNQDYDDLLDDVNYREKPRVQTGEFNLRVFNVI
jgi:ribose-phosphate pyrophosphokinase